MIFHRPDYAASMSQLLLQPSMLQMQVRSGLFLPGVRRTGKTTFLRQDLVPALENNDALVIYVDLWADPSKNPAALVYEAVASTIIELATPGSALLARFKRVSIDAAGLSFGFELEGTTTPKTTILGKLLTQLVDKTKGNVVLIIDEVQHALGSQPGRDLLTALKSARDAVNTRPDTDGYLLIVGTGSHKSMIADMTTRRSQAFAGAMYLPMEELSQDFVEWLRQGMEVDGLKLPSLPVMVAGFHAIGRRPEELHKAIFLLQDVSEPADIAFPIICHTLASAIADTEIAVVLRQGDLAAAIFDRVAKGADDGEKGLFSVAALVHYQSQLGSNVTASSAQNEVNKLIEENLIHRVARGYTVADPLVRAAWLRRDRMIKDF